MIHDNRARTHRYQPLGPRVALALEYVRSSDFGTVPDGRHPIDGDRVYALVQSYSTKLPEQGTWEAHRRYMDLQFVIEGSEQIGYLPPERTPEGEYDAARDFVTVPGLASDGDLLTLGAGDFMLIWPGEAHIPGLAIGPQATVRKVVVKIDCQRDGA
jgi:YhcH/YjgK/YiaL family protein